MSNVDALFPYKTPEQREQALDAAALSLGAVVHTIGSSVMGRPIRAAHVRATKPSSHSLLVCAGIHGLEYIATEVALGVLDALGTSAWSDIREQADVWVIPSLNPDGYARTWQSKGNGRLMDFRRNARGVDLNRNYPLPGLQRRVLTTFSGWRTGSSDEANAFYRGAYPLSEPETHALDELCARIPFHASVNLHATMGTLIVPCVHAPASARTYEALCRGFARGQARTRYKTISAGGLDRYTGEQEDHQHAAYRTWSICVEHYPLWVQPTRFLQRNLFWRFNPRDPTVWVDNDVPGIAEYFRVAMTYARPSD